MENPMSDWYTRPVLFVKDVQASLDFYISQLGFKQDWRNNDVDELIVAQVSRDSLEIILNKDDGSHGAGRVFVNLSDEDIEPIRQRIRSLGVVATSKWWGMPITEILDLDKNELFFSPPIS
jgi:catechol 2,3-dioxygenase-like lactoylglutathione lyase family enzyme